MVELKAGQAVRVYAAVWDFCGASYQAIYISDVVFDIIPTPKPAGCLSISGIGIEFRLVTLSGSGECNMCTPGKVYSTWGNAYTDSQGLAYTDHIITDEDLAAFQETFSAGNTLKVLACITGSKGQQVSSHRCSETLTILPGAVPTYAVEFKVFENTLGILDVLSNYTGRLTAAINTIMPDGAGWNVARTEIDSSNGIIRLYLSETGSWNIEVMAKTLLILVNAAIAVLLFALFPGPLGVALGIMATLFFVYWVIDLGNMAIILEEQVKNFESKDQNDTKLDQMLANVLDQYEKSPKTKDDCANKLNGLKLSYINYLDVMQKDFSNLYTIPMKRAFESQADGAIGQFRNGTITCEQATEIILTKGAIAKSDASTNFSTVYNVNNPYVPPKKEDCWISKPLGEGCLLSANTGMWLVGTAVAVIGLGITYWAVTRKPQETRVVIEKAKAEVARAKAAYKIITTPAAPQITGAPIVARG